MSNLDEIKKQIESRYNRLHSRYRRPSFEYVATEEIKKIFRNYATDLEKFDNLTDEELRILFDEFFKKKDEVQTEGELKIREVELEDEL